MDVKTLNPNLLTRLQLSYRQQPEHLSAMDSPFLRALAESDKRVLNHIFVEQRFEPGTILIQEGLPGEAMYLVRSGMLAIVKGDLDAPTILGYRGAGEIVGEMSLIDEHPSSASVIALEGAQVLQISRDNFQIFLANNLSAGQSLMKTLSLRLRESDNARRADLMIERQLALQVNTLKTRQQQLLEIQRLRHETRDFILHDLRSPVTSLTGFVDLLKIVLPEAVLQENQEILDMARASCDHLLEQVNSLLEITRLEAGELPLNLHPTLVPFMIDQTLSRIGMGKQSHTRLNLVFPPNLPAAQADSELLGRVIKNLLDNSFRHTPRGGSITISAELKEGMIQVEVADSGPTIPPDEREHLFERFAQRHSGAPPQRSAGLTLVFCRLAIEAHRGRIWIADGLNGQGVRFIFTLPVVANAE